MKFLLLPFSWIYGLIAWVRNKLYDRGILKSYESSASTIVIGNLQVGGSGKTPHTAYLYKWLSAYYRTAILSRGYGRSTRGLLAADNTSTPETIGDEPYWYVHALGAKVVVSEKRKKGLQYLEQEGIELVLLDDAYQHRAVSGDINMMLTEYTKPYFNDYPMPFGRLREYRTGDKRADIILVTKCPSRMSLQEKVDIIHQINPLDHQHIFFTTVVPGNLYPVIRDNKVPQKGSYKRAVALSGIANPEPFVTMCKEFAGKVEALSYKDHHSYTSSDIERIMKMLDQDTVVICTEKDAVKLGKYKDRLSDGKFFVLPIEVQFLFNEEQKFRTLVRELLQ